MHKGSHDERAREAGEKPYGSEAQGSQHYKVEFVVMEVKEDKNPTSIHWHLKLTPFLPDSHDEVIMVLSVNKHGEHPRQKQGCA